MLIRSVPLVVRITLDPDQEEKMHSLSSYVAKFASALVSRHLGSDGSVTDVTVIEVRGVVNMAEYAVTGKRSINALLIPVMAKNGMTRANLLPTVQWIPVLHAAKRAASDGRKGSGVYASHAASDGREGRVIVASTMEDFELAMSWLRPEHRPTYGHDELVAFWDTYPGASLIVIIFGEKEGPETLRVAYWQHPMYPDQVMVPTAFGAISSTSGESRSTSGISYTVMLAGEMLMPDSGIAVEVPDDLPGTLAFPPPTHVFCDMVAPTKVENDLYYRVSGNAIVECPEPVHHPAPARVSHVAPRRTSAVSIRPIFAVS